jgi:hypothetical protein
MRYWWVNQNQTFRQEIENVGAFSQGQRSHLDFHRENVLRMAHGIKN